MVHDGAAHELLKQIENSFDPRKRAPPKDVASARAVVERVLRAIPSCERNRLSNLAWSVTCTCITHEVFVDRMYCALESAAELHANSVEELVCQIETKKTTVGILMTQSGAK